MMHRAHTFLSVQPRVAAIILALLAVRVAPIDAVQLRRGGDIGALATPAQAGVASLAAMAAVAPTEGRSAFTSRVMRVYGVKSPAGLGVGRRALPATCATQSAFALFGPVCSPAREGFLALLPRGLAASSSLHEMTTATRCAIGTRPAHACTFSGMVVTPEQARLPANALTTAPKGMETRHHA